MSNTKKQPEYSPMESIERALKHWWIIVLLTIVGAAAGWTLHFFDPPVYEASAIITGGMHFEQRQLTQSEIDLAYAIATVVASSQSVKDQALANAQAQGLSFGSNTPELILEIKGDYWILRVRDHDPQLAAALANIWAQTAYEALDQARQHAYRAEQIQVEIAELQNCLSSREQITATSQSSSSVACENLTLDQIQAAIDEQSNQLATEQNLSQGIISILDFTLTDPASVPETPVLYDRAKLTFAGACIGFIISLWVASIYKARRCD